MQEPRGPEGTQVLPQHQRQTSDMASARPRSVPRHSSFPGAALTTSISRGRHVHVRIRSRTGECLPPSHKPDSRSSGDLLTVGTLVCAAAVVSR